MMLRQSGVADALSCKWIYGAVGFHVACALVLAPVTSHPYDVAVLTSNAQAWLDWGFSPFYNWKFGSDLAALTLLAQSGRAFLSSFGLPGPVALHVAWKLPLVAADLLAAGAIFRVGQHFAPRRAAPLAALWLLNPVVLWVSAAHGQVESLAVLCTFAALALAIDGRLFAAGIVTGLGVGIEYFPMAVLATVLVWWRGGHLPPGRPMLSYGAGLALSLIACFLPPLVSPTARSALAGGLASSSGLTAGSVSSLLSIWPWLGYHFQPLWPFVLLTVDVACLVAGILFAKRGPRVGLTVLALVLVATLLLDGNTLPQFAPIAAAALWLLAMVVPANALVLVAVPAAGLATYFFFLDSGASTANAFFYDDWFLKGAALWAVPVDQHASVLLGRLFSVGLLVSVAYALIFATRSPRWAWRAGSGVGIALSLAAIAWTLQPAIWITAFSATPSQNLPDFQYATARQGSYELLGPNVFRLKYSESLVNAAREAPTRPTSALSIAMGDIVAREESSLAKPAYAWNDPTLSIPDWTNRAALARSLWFELRLGAESWSKVLGPKLTDLNLSVNGRLVSARAAHIAQDTGAAAWAYVDFEVPASDVAPDGLVTIEPHPDTILWSGSPAGPWIRVAPASGTIPVLTNFHIQNAGYAVTPYGQGYLAGFPLETNSVVDLSSALGSPPHIQAAVLLWPSTPETWKLSPLIKVVGGLFFVLTIIVTAAITRRHLTSTKPHEAQRAWTPQPEPLAT